MLRFLRDTWSLACVPARIGRDARRAVVNIAARRFGRFTELDRLIILDLVVITALLFLLVWSGGG